MYKVIKLFTDLQDGNHLYNVGDFYPRQGSNVSKERLGELLSSDNKQGEPLIELIKEKKIEKVAELIEEKEETEILENVEKQVKKKKK